MVAHVYCEECSKRIVRSNQRALARTIKALHGLGPEHDALVQHAKTLASLVDLFPAEVKLHTEYREVLKRLTDAGKAEETDAWEQLQADLAADATT